MAKRSFRKKKEIPGLDETFLTDANSMSDADRDARILTLTVHLDESEDFLKNDQAILDAKADLALMVGPTKETIRATKNRIKYLVDQKNGKQTQNQGSV